MRLCNHLAIDINITYKQRAIKKYQLDIKQLNNRNIKTNMTYFRLTKKKDPFIMWKIIRYGRSETSNLKYKFRERG